MGTGTRALDEIKIKLTKTPVLQYFDVKKPVILSVDSSMSGTGAVLLQNNLPVAYVSKALTKTQQKYSQLEEEMFAIYFGLTRFHDYVYGEVYGKQDVTVETNHLPLIRMFNKPLNKAPARLQRMLILVQVQKYDFKLVYKRGKDLIIADALSRAYINVRDNDDSEAHVNLVKLQMGASDELLTKIKTETNKDPDLVELSRVILTGWPNNNIKLHYKIKIYSKYKSELSVVDGVVYKNRSIVIPSNMRKYILDKLHYNHMRINK